MLYPLLYSPLQPLLRTAFERGPSGLDQQIAQLFRAGEMGVWYDPSDMSTMWQDAAQTTRAVIGSPVGYISDKSGNGFAATQAVAGSRPTLQQTNGLNYLQFDGVDDFLQTASINFTATAAITVAAGVRKTSDAAIGTVSELSVAFTANDGSFALRAPATAGDTFGFGARGTSTVQLAPTGFTAPATAVLAAQANLATPSTSLRVNTASTSSASALGGGTFGNYPIFLGERGGGTLPFAGNLYGLIVRGAASNAAQINIIETYLNMKTGAF